MDIIKTFDGREWKKSDLIKSMGDDSFYYGYLGKECLSASAIKQMYMNGSWEFEETKETSALRMGALIHLVVLEPHRINDLVFVAGTRASRKFKDLKSAGYDVYTFAEYKKARTVSKAVEKNFEAFGMLYECEKEVPEIKMIEGLPIRGKADAINRSSGLLVDLKTTADINFTDQSLLKYGYDIQGALYCDLFGVEEFVIVWVDKTSLQVKIQYLGAELIAQGRDKYLKALTLFKQP